MSSNRLSSSRESGDLANQGLLANAPNRHKPIPIGRRRMDTSSESLAKQNSSATEPGIGAIFKLPHRPFVVPMCS